MHDRDQSTALDSARKPLNFLVAWGIPIAGLLCANFLTPWPLVAVSVVIAAFAWIGIACLLNARRCNRVHCWFTGPWCLLLAGLLFANAFIGLRPFDWGFSDLANWGGLVTVLLWIVPELIWGRYFGNSSKA